MDPATPPYSTSQQQEAASSMPKLSASRSRLVLQKMTPSDDSSRDEDASPCVRRKRKRRQFCYASSEDEAPVNRGGGGGRRRGKRVESDEDSGADSSPQVSPDKDELPLGVLQARAGTTGFQLILTKYRPEAARIPCIDYAPVFYPKEEEFEDTLKYIESIRPAAEPYGICRVVPPKSWKPPCSLKDNAEEHIQFATRVQKIHKLQVREPSTRVPFVHESRTRTRVSKTLKFIGSMHGGSGPQQEFFGFEPGPNFTIKEFETMAYELKEKYFRLDEPNPDGSKKPEPSIQAIEGEYWRMVEGPSEQMEVLYGADIETNSFKSGFPKSTPGSDTEKSSYEKSGWNLNNIARLKNSILEFEEGEISGVVVPWLYVGMCFSSFCWHVEDHHLYSVNYMHWGAPKVWYGVPAYAATKLEQAMKKRLPELFNEQPDLLHKLVTQMSPSVLKDEGVPVYRVVQHAGDFVITFPRAYHAGFNTGFNCAEAVNVAPVNWLSYGQNAVEIYKEQRRKTSISHDKLLLSAVTRALTFTAQSDGSFTQFRQIVAEALEVRLKLEAFRRQSLSGLATTKMDAEFDAKEERECAVCAYDLHLSAVGCGCYPQVFGCLEHAKSFCSCGWGKKYALYRYELPELEELLRQLEGDQPVLKLKISGPKHEVQGLGTGANSESTSDIAQTRNVPSPPVPDNVPSRSGPRVAKVVRPAKASYDVELVNVGRIVLKSGWYTKHAIFPAGFKSRVVFHDYLNLPETCNYLSEVLDCTDGKPLFKVSMEGRPFEKFVCSSIDMCWQGIQERVNSEIKRLRQVGRTRLPPLRPPESIRGIDMFGFSSSTITKAVEALDPCRLCTSYWRGTSLPSDKEEEEVDEDEEEGSRDALGKPLFGNEQRYATFKGFLSKTGQDQLSELQQILGSKWTADSWYRG